MTQETRNWDGTCSHCGKALPTVRGGRIPGHSELGVTCPGSYLPSATLDAVDQAMLDEATAARREHDKPLIGDFVTFPDGHYERFSHDWGDGLQTSTEGSFYLLSNGQGSFSGSLNPPIPNESIVPTQSIREGRFWFFHHNMAEAHNGVDVKVYCRVWAVNS